MKQALKNIVVAILGRQVKKLRRKHDIKVVGVVGSIGKTSTKLAIAQTLSKSRRVRYQQGNYNDLVTVPLIFFGHETPSLFNPIAWSKIFLSNAKQIRSYPYDVVVVEIGTNAPGDIAAFKKYLELDIAVVTAISAEHMEFFADMQAVADEELSVAQYAKQIIYNADLVAASYRAVLPEGTLSYGIKDVAADYHLANVFHSAAGYEGDIKHGAEEIFLHISHESVFETQLYSVLAACIVGGQLGLKKTEILEGIAAVLPVSGRLRRLRGINRSIIIDDTYNSSPEAVKAGLEALYKIEAPQRIAILGNMNELGGMSAAAHKEIGELCDPTKLQLVITLGADANAHTAPAAEAKGCMVKKFDDPYAVGEYLQSKVETEAIIFAKGSQNGVFAEEAIKTLLADPEDAAKLVRQSDYWMRRKKTSFKGK